MDRNRRAQKQQPAQRQPPMEERVAAPSAYDGGPEAQQCPVCTEPIVIAAFGECNHHLCHLCNLRLRALYDVRACSICKTELGSVVYAGKGDEKSRLFADYDLGRNMHNHRSLGIYTPNREILDEVNILLRFNCPDALCSVACSNWSDLKTHIKRAHQRVFCDICVRNKKVFVHEHSLYTNDGLQKHIKKGDSGTDGKGDGSFKGHPDCGFCREYFYDSDELFEHCRSKHEVCHICQRSGSSRPNSQHEYYKNYEALEKHFNQYHYFCHDQDCLDKKFVVFDNEIDFKAHMTREHGTGMDKNERKQARNIRVEFGGRTERGQSASGSRSSRDGRSERQQQDREREVELKQQDGGIEVPRTAETLPEVTNSRFNVPPGFGSQLSSRPTRAQPSISELATASSNNTGPSNAEPKESRPLRDEWPEIAARELGQRKKIYADRVYDDINDSKVLGMLDSDPSIREHEGILAPIILSHFDNELKPWMKFRSNCLNYLKGFILPEKVFEQFESLLGLGKSVNVFKDVVKLFPENKRGALLRVLNDKKVRLRALTEEREGTPVRIGRSWETTLNQSGSTGGGGETSSKSKVLGIKSHTRGNVSHFHVPAASHTRDEMKPIAASRQNDGAASRSQFPSLPSNSNGNRNELEDWIGTTKQGKAVLMSTSRPSYSSPPVQSLHMSAAGGKKILKKNDFPSLEPKSKVELEPWMSRRPAPASAGSSWNGGSGQRPPDRAANGDKKEEQGGKKKRVVLRLG